MLKLSTKISIFSQSNYIIVMITHRFKDEIKALKDGIKDGIYFFFFCFILGLFKIHADETNIKIVDLSFGFLYFTTDK